MPENLTNKDEILSAMEKTLKKYKIFLLSAVGILIVTVLFFTNYDAGSKLQGFTGGASQEQNVDVQGVVKGTATQPDSTPEIVPELTVKTKTAVPPPCTEGQKTSDGMLICKNGKLEIVTAVIPPESTEIIPELTVKTKTVVPPTEEKTPELTAKTKTVSSITLTKVSLSETTFNPLVKSATFTIKTSADAKIDIKIYNKDGNIVSSPASNKDITGNKEYEVVWDGDNDAKKTLTAGTYSYKVFAKDSTTKEIADTKTGDIILKYGTTVTSDFENINGKTSGSNSASTTQTTQAVAKPSSSNAQAVMTLQNSKEGKTAGTGPETIIYLIFPILGYTVSRKFK